MEKGTKAPSAVSFPEVALASGGYRMPVIGMGSAANPLEFKTVVLEAIKIGYRHFDTASVYGSEKPLGEALAEAMERKLVTREELFITSKLWSSDSHPHLVAPALQKSLRTLQLEYMDLYLIHSRISSKPVEKQVFPIPVEDMVPMDYKGVWEAMEDCQRQGVIVTAYSPLGAKGTAWGSNIVMENETLNQIAQAHGKSVAQI